LLKILVGAFSAKLRRGFSAITIYYLILIHDLITYY